VFISGRSAVIIQPGIFASTPTGLRAGARCSSVTTLIPERDPLFRDTNSVQMHRMMIKQVQIRSRTGFIRRQRVVIALQRR